MFKDALRHALADERVGRELPGREGADRAVHGGRGRGQLTAAAGVLRRGCSCETAALCTARGGAHSASPGEKVKVKMSRTGAADRAVGGGQGGGRWGAVLDLVAIPDGRARIGSRPYGSAWPERERESIEKEILRESIEKKILRERIEKKILRESASKEDSWRAPQQKILR